MACRARYARALLGSCPGGPRSETYLPTVPLCRPRWAGRSAEDRRLRKAEAVGSNPTRSTRLGHPSLAPHLPQKASSGSRTVPHCGQAYSIRVPHLPQNASCGPRGAPQPGHPPSSGGGLAAHSGHRRTGVPLRRTGFQAAVFLPHSAQVRSRASRASIRRSSGRDDGGGASSGGASSSGGRAMAPAIRGSVVKPSDLTLPSES